MLYIGCTIKPPPPPPKPTLTFDRLRIFVNRAPADVLRIGNLKYFRQIWGIDSHFQIGVVGIYRVTPNLKVIKIQINGSLKIFFP